MSIKSKMVATAAALTAVGGLSTAATLHASASTTQCGSACVQISSKLYGPGFVESAFQGIAAAGQPTILHAASNSDPPETSSTPSATRCWYLRSTRRGWCPRR